MSSSSESESSDNEEQTVFSVKTTSKSKSKSKSKSSDSDSDNEEQHVSSVKTTSKSKEKPKESLSNSESSDNEEQVSSVKTMPEKSKEKTKLTVDQLLADIAEIQQTIDTDTMTYLEQVKEFESSQKQYHIDFKKNQKKFTMFLDKLPKVLQKELKGKNKRKTVTGGKKGGILKPAQVPLRLRKYLDIDEDALHTRPQVYSKLCTKLREQGFKDPENGKNTIISKSKDAKALNVDKGFTFNTYEGQQFLKTFYEEEKEQLVLANA
jgi:hypothetical protein